MQMVPHVSCTILVTVLKSRVTKEAKLHVFGKRGTEVCLLPKLYDICWIETHFQLDSCNFRAESKTREVN